jgi:hypothetical protein
MAGYSKRSLVEKLGIKPGFRCLSVNAPKDYAKILGKIPTGAEFSVARGSVSAESCDFVHAFFETRAQLEKSLPELKPLLKKNGALWISWRKGKVSDVTENIVRQLALAIDLVDVKVCAVDDIWSGLKLVYRLRDR